jgi:hypothetical protein
MPKKTVHTAASESPSSMLMFTGKLLRGIFRIKICLKFRFSQFFNSDGFLFFRDIASDCCTASNSSDQLKRGRRSRTSNRFSADTPLPKTTKGIFLPDGSFEFFV